MPKQIITYKCSFCNDIQRYATKEECLRHETNCKYNPIVKNCMTCKGFHIGNYHENIDPNCSISNIFVGIAGNLAMISRCRSHDLAKEYGGK